MKLYADEVGHRDIRRLTTLAVSQLARVEVPAALWRKQRMGEIAAEDARLLVAEFEADFSGTATEAPRFAVIALTTTICDQAARLCAVHRLRAYDAAQLSAALAARQADNSCSTVAAFDRSLRTAASAEGFALVPG